MGGGGGGTIRIGKKHPRESETPWKVLIWQERDSLCHRVAPGPLSLDESRGGRALAAVSGSYCCPNELPLTQQLETTRMYYLSVLEV